MTKSKTKFLEIPGRNKIEINDKIDNEIFEKKVKSRLESLI
jgi:hypothetical protein